MASPVVIIDSTNNRLKFYPNLDVGEDIDYIVIDNDKTFVCVNEPSDIGMSALKIDINTLKLYNDVNGDYYLLDTSMMPIDIDNDLMFMFIHLIPTASNPSLTEPKYLLVVLYNNNELLKLIWNDVKMLTKEECCTDVCRHNNMILYKYGFEIARQGRYVRDMIDFWHKMHSNKTISNSNCGCNG